jgi:hypothetical protein
VKLSNKLHNLDKQQLGRAAMLQREVWLLRCNFVGISGCITTTFLLWSANFHWGKGLHTASTIACLLFALVVALALFSWTSQRSQYCLQTTCSNGGGGVQGG